MAGKFVGVGLYSYFVWPERRERTTKREVQ
jgi:hypothetical protein